MCGHWILPLGAMMPQQAFGTERYVKGMGLLPSTPRQLHIGCANIAQTVAPMVVRRALYHHWRFRVA